VATEEPQIAPNAALAMTDAIASPPRRPPTSAAVNSNKALLIPPCVANWPMRMNSGITERS
jgi:hypothetical protein